MRHYWKNNFQQESRKENVSGSDYLPILYYWIRNNEKMTQYSNKFRPFINKDDKIIMYDEINKLYGIFQINDDMNDYNV